MPVKRSTRQLWQNIYFPYASHKKTKWWGLVWLKTVHCKVKLHKWKNPGLASNSSPFAYDRHCCWTFILTSIVKKKQKPSKLEESRHHQCSKGEALQKNYNPLPLPPNVNCSVTSWVGRQLRQPTVPHSESGHEWGRKEVELPVSLTGNAGQRQLRTLTLPTHNLHCRC